MKQLRIWLTLLTILISGSGLGVAGTVLFVRMRIADVTKRASADPAEAALQVMMDRVQMTPEQREHSRAVWNKWAVKIQLSRLQAIAVSNKPAYGFVQELSSLLQPEQQAKLDTLINDRIRAVNPSTLSKMFDAIALTWEQKERVDDIFAKRAAELDQFSATSPEAAGRRLLLDSQPDLNQVLQEPQRRKLAEYIARLPAGQ